MSLLTAFYDLERGPVSYDFITWLVRALMERDARKLDSLHVVIVPKEDGLGGFSRHWGPHDEHAARWRLWHIVIAACPLARATVTLAASRVQAERLQHGQCWWPAERVHLAGPIMEAARKGVAIPRLQATEAARQYVKASLANVERPWGTNDAPVVTFTLRRQTNDPARNSDEIAFEEFAQWLMRERYAVLQLDDTHMALSQGRGYAELDIDLRLALYEQAAMNFVGNNGPAALLWHSKAPYMRMGAGIPSDWQTNLGLAQGEQVPWATRDQRLVYAPDSFEAMKAVFLEWAVATS